MCGCDVGVNLENPVIVQKDENNCWYQMFINPILEIQDQKIQHTDQKLSIPIQVWQFIFAVRSIGWTIQSALNRSADSQGHACLK